MKKVLSLVLALVLVLGMSAVAFAKIADNPHKLEDLRLGASYSDVNNLSNVYVAGDARPDDKYYFRIYDSAITTGDDALYREDVRDLKLDIQIRATEGSSAIRDAKIEYESVRVLGADNKVITRQRAMVVVRMVEVFESTKEQDFDVLLYITSEKKRIRGTGSGNNDYDQRFTGTLENYYTEVDEYDDYVYAYDTPVIKALDYIRNITVDLGQGVTITTKMFADKKYYGRVSQEVKAEDEAIVAKYPDIDTIYYLRTIGLSSTGDVVAFKDLGDNFYVYVQNADGNLVYIGRSNEKLPYFTKYFLAAKELEVDADLEVPSGDVEPEGGPEAGGDDAPANINDNPSTGR